MNNPRPSPLLGVPSEPGSLVGRRRRQRGAETVELALTLLPLLAILFSFIIAGFIMYTKVSTAYLAREGVQWAIKRGNEADIAASPDPVRPDAPATLASIRGYVQSIGLLTLTPDSIQACWYDARVMGSSCGNLDPGVNNLPGCSVRVTVSYTFNPPLADYVWPDAITMDSTAEGVILF